MAELQVHRPEALSVLPAAYGPLLDRAVAVLAADDRVRALWVSGSLARVDADASSDLDLLVAVADDAFDEFAGSWREWLAAITPTVLAREIPNLAGSFYSLTPTCERLDVVAERAGDLPRTGFRCRAIVFDRDGLDALVPEEPPPAGPDPAKVLTAIEEPLRYLALLPAVLARGELLLAQEGYAHLRRRISELFLEANAPLPTTGVKHWRDKLSDEQYAVLEALPWPQADRDELIAAYRSIAGVLLAHGRPVADAVGVPWPQPLEDAVRVHLLRELDLALP